MSEEIVTAAKIAELRWIDDPARIMRRIGLARAFRNRRWYDGWVLEVHVELWHWLRGDIYVARAPDGEGDWELGNGWIVRVVYSRPSPEGVPKPDHKVQAAQWVARDRGQTFVVPVDLTED